MVLLNTCTIKRKSYVVEDAPEPTYTWSVVYENVPCSIQYKRGTERDGEFVGITDYEIYVSSGLDVQRGDQVYFDDHVLDIIAVGDVFNRFIKITCKEVSRT